MLNSYSTVFGFLLSPFLLSCLMGLSENHDREIAKVEVKCQAFLRSFKNSPANSSKSVGGLACAVPQISLASFEVGGPISTFGKPKPRSLPPLCIHCFAWKPNTLSAMNLCGPTFWWGFASSSLVFVPVLKAFKSDGSFLWRCVCLSLVVWCMSDFPSGARFSLLSKLINNPCNSKFALLAFNINPYWFIFSYIIIHFSIDSFKSLLYLSSLTLAIYEVLCCFPEAAMASKEQKTTKNCYKLTFLYKSDLVSSEEKKLTGFARYQVISSLVGEVQSNGKNKAATKQNDNSLESGGVSLSKRQAKINIASLCNKLAKVLSCALGKVIHHKKLNNDDLSCG